MDKTRDDYNRFHLGKFEKNIGPPSFKSFLQYINLSMYQNVISQLENHSQLLRGHDFANERLLVCQFHV